MTLRADPAEDLALSRLERQGLLLIARNYACRGGEIDLIMRDGATLVFVGKQRRLALAAQHYLVRHPAWASWPMRFDVVAFSGPLDRAEFRWIRNAIMSSG